MTPDTGELRAAPLFDFRTPRAPSTNRAVGSSGLRVGRRPPGVVVLDPSPPTDAATYFAQLATLLTVSTEAFYAMRDDLRLYGAPPRLVRGAERAAHDDVKNAARVTRLAARFGAALPSAPRLFHTPLSLSAFAEHNAFEGCVRQTFGASEMALQARGAQESDIASALRQLAKDEERHAQLAWHVLEWLESRMDDSAEQLSRVMSAAVGDLYAAIETPAAALVESVGLPSREASIACADDLARKRWRRFAEPLSSPRA